MRWLPFLSLLAFGCGDDDFGHERAAQDNAVVIDASVDAAVDAALDQSVVDLAAPDLAGDLAAPVDANADLVDGAGSN